MSTLTRITIDVPGSPTVLLIGRGAIGQVADVLAGASVAVRDRRVLLVVDGNVMAVGARIDQSLRTAGAHTATVRLTATELGKSVASVESIWHAALAHGLGRTGLILAIGGGIIGDLAGFAAATFLRGVECVQVPTTLLAMVDAAIGGKTGINLPLPGGGLGKNLAGAFWQPRLAIADPDVLSTLPARELRAGLAECIKHAVIAGLPHFEFLERRIELLAAGDPMALGELIPLSAAVKAGIVARDPLERGERAVLNLGHTFGHAIETIPGADLLHGEAVAIGMVAACRCAVVRGLLAVADADRIERLIERAGLPTRLPSSLSAPESAGEIRRRMGFDKKVDGERLRLILPNAVGDVRIVAIPPAADRRPDGHPDDDDGVQAGIAAIASAR